LTASGRVLFVDDEDVRKKVIASSPVLRKVCGSEDNESE